MMEIHRLTATCVVVVVTLLCLSAGAHVSCPASCSCVESDVTNSGGRHHLSVTCSTGELTSLPAKLPTSAASLDVSGNRLELLDSASLPHTGVHGLSTANFSRNRIVTIATESFGRWSNLVSLDLSANRLTSIDHGTFRGAAQTSLQNLDLSGNRLTEVDGGFSGMANLFRLDLRNNYLTSLTEFTFRDLSALRYLFLTNNRIHHIERRALRHLKHLLYLVLRGNPLADIARFHFHSPSTLSYIDMSECGLTTVPRGLPSALRYIQLRRNNLTILDAQTFSQCPQLNILVLDENKIQTVHDGTFASMSHLQQLWLNENHLLALPRPLPASLRRLLVDSNHLETVEDSDTFPMRSQLTTLSLAGNHLHLVSPAAFRRATNLQSLDVSNNQLRRIETSTFSTNTNLRSLSLAKNPLDTIETDAFKGLRSLKALTLSYVPTVDVRLHDADPFRPLSRLTRLDLDNSPGVVKALLWTELGDGRSSHVEELGLVNCDLTTLPSDFPRRFPRLTALRVSSSQWHCDRAMRWFRDWLLEPAVEVRVQSLSDLRCATPRSVRHRPIVSLSYDEFVETTWTPRPPPTSTPTVTTSSTTKTTTTTTKVRRPVVRVSTTQQPTDRDNQEFVTERQPGVQQTTTSVSDVARTSSVKRVIVPMNVLSTPWLNDLHQSSLSTSESPRHRSRPHLRHTKRGGNHGHHHGNQPLNGFKTRLIIIAATIGVTIVIAAFIVAAIVYLWLRSRKPSKPLTPPPPSLSAADYDDETLATTPRTFIKYKNKNGVLFFSTPAADSASTTADSDDVMPDSCVIGETGADGTGTFRYVLPPSSAGYKTRVYRWEDF